MRIIIGSAGAQSDLMFVFAMAKELQQRNHVVTLVVPEKYRSYIMKMEVRMVTCGKSFEEYLEGNPGEYQNELAKSLASQVASQFVSLRDALREADVFISGTFLVPAASMAEKLNLPFFQVIQSPLLLNPDEFPLEGIPIEKVSGFLSGRKKAAIREEWEDTIGKILNKERSFTHLEPVHNLYRQMYAYGHQIVAVDPEFSEIANAVNRSVSGYFNAEPLIDQSLPGFIEGKRKIFIGPLHIVQSEREPFLQSLSAALAESDFQIVVRSDWTGGQDKQLPENCVAVEPSIETAVMSQSAVVIHQGAGPNVMSCARAGVPQVVIPFLVDHAFWAERVETLKLGPEPLDKIEPKAVAGAVSKALNMRDSASAFAEKKRDQDGITAACDVIESIAGEKIAG